MHLTQSLESSGAHDIGAYYYSNYSYDEYLLYFIGRLIFQFLFYKFSLCPLPQSTFAALYRLEEMTKHRDMNRENRL